MVYPDVSHARDGDILRTGKDFDIALRMVFGLIDLGGVNAFWLVLRTGLGTVLKWIRADEKSMNMSTKITTEFLYSNIY